jgi:glycerol-3-phosphate acyltransferase PlsY
MMIALYPVAVAVCIFTFGVTLITWGYVSVSSMTASVTLPLVVIILPLIGFLPPPQPLVIFSIMVPIFVFLTHRDNISRLFQGNEKRVDRAVLFGRKKTQDS